MKEELALKPEEPGWLTAAGCCVVLLVAWLTFALTTSSAIPKALIWVRRQLHSVRGFMGLFLARSSLGVSACSITNRETVSDVRKEPQRVTLSAPSAQEGERERGSVRMRKEVMSSLGSLVPSVLVSTCCLGPTLYVLFGVSVGGLSIFTPLEPYRPAFMLAALGLLGYAFHHLYIRPPQFDCVEDGRSALRTSRVVFWIASLVFVVAALYPVVLPYFFS